MIYLNKDTNNDVYVTLTEKTTLTDVIYIIALTGENTNNTKHIQLTELSANIYRYNQFNITTVSDIALEDLDNSIVHLVTEGFYDYTVYEANLELIEASIPVSELNIVETGKAFLNGVEGWNDNGTVENTYTENTNTRVVYNG